MIKISPALGLALLLACAHKKAAPAPAPDLACGPLSGKAAARLLASATLYDPLAGVGFGDDEVPLAPLLPAVAREHRVLAARALFPPGAPGQLALLLSAKDEDLKPGRPPAGNVLLGLAECGPAGFALIAPPGDACGTAEIGQLLRSEPVALPGGDAASSLLLLCGNPDTLEMEEIGKLVGRGTPALPVLDPKGAAAGLLASEGMLGQQFLITGDGPGAGGYARNDALAGSGWFPLGSELVHVTLSKQKTTPGAQIRVGPSVPPRPKNPRFPFDDAPLAELWLFIGKGEPPPGCTGLTGARCVRLDSHETKEMVALAAQWVAGAWPTAQEAEAGVRALGADPSAGDWFHSEGDQAALGPGGKKPVTGLAASR